MNGAQAAEFLGLAKSTFYKLLTDGRGPKFTKVSPKVFVFRQEDLEAWLEEKTAPTGGHAANTIETLKASLVVKEGELRALQAEFDGLAGTSARALKILFLVCSDLNVDCELSIDRFPPVPPLGVIEEVIPNDPLPNKVEGLRDVIYELVVGLHGLRKVGENHV